MNNCYSINRATLKKRAISWLFAVIGLLMAAGYLIHHSKLNSSVLALLPKEQTNRVPTELIDGFQDRLDKQLVFLIKPLTPDDMTPVIWWYNRLRQQPFIEQVNGLFDDQFQQQWGQFAYQYRYQLLDDSTARRLQSHQQLAWIQSQLYSPFSGVSSKELHNDPLLLTRSSQLNQLSHAGNLTIKNNFLSGQDEQGDVWYMIYAELSGSSFNISRSHQIVTQLNQLTAELQTEWPNTELLKRGVLFYSDNASVEAQNDITTIGSLSLIGIIIVIITLFRSITPIWLSLLSIFIGIVSGLVAVLTVFGEIHVITLVMSTSIIGIAIDYSLHYLTERLLHGNQESPYTSLKKLIATLTIALCTSFIAYLMLLIAPFPGLKQLSIFAVFGLVGAFLTVICWYPLLVKKLPVREHIGQQCLNFWLNLWQKRAMPWTMVSLALLFIVYGMSNLKIDDDIGKLQALPAQLKAQEQKMIRITHQSTDQKWFIVFGDNAQQTLQRLETLLPKLERAKQNGVFEQYQAINIPSIQRQQQNIALIDQYAPDIITALKSLNIETKVESGSVIDRFITPELWQQSAMSQGRKLLWLSLKDGKSATLIPISGVQQLTHLTQLSDIDNGVYWLDRRAEFNAMFSRYRIHLSQLIAAAVAMICLSFIGFNRKYGIKIALKSTLPTLLSVGMALSVHGIINQPLNLFSMLALILVIGIGIDYSLFLSNQNSQTQSALLAVSMAAITTILSFGLLILSHTSAIKGFGLVLTSGIFAAFLFAPLAVNNSHKYHHQPISN